MGKGGYRKASRVEEECGREACLCLGREGRAVEWVHVALTALPFQTEAGWKGAHGQQFRTRPCESCRDSTLRATEGFCPERGAGPSGATVESAKQGDARVPGKWPAASPSAPGEWLLPKGNRWRERSGSNTRGTPPICRGRSLPQESSGAAPTGHRSPLSNCLGPGCNCERFFASALGCLEEKDGRGLDPGGGSSLLFLICTL